MTSNEVKFKFSSNLKNLMEIHGKTQSDIVTDLQLRQATVSDWINGKKYPRMDKVELLANYFNVPISALVENPSKTVINPFTDYEIELIKKYRQLDADGKRAVDDMIDFKLFQQNQKDGSTENKVG